MNLNLKKVKSSGPVIDLTPMIDCIMNLFIFLMCISAVTVIIGITIKVPPPSPDVFSQPSIEENLEVFLYQDIIMKGHKIIEEGIIKLNGRRVSIEDFVNRLALEKQRIGKDFLVIKGQDKVYHYKVVKIMDLAKTEKVGIKSFTLEPPTKSEE